MRQRVTCSEQYHELQPVFLMGQQVLATFFYKFRVPNIGNYDGEP